jgi:hypothetical protein
MYGARSHTRKIQDLPIDQGELIQPEQRALLREYCGNDLRLTQELFDKFQAQLELRAQMTDEYGVCLMSKSDAQIAEAVMKQTLDFKPNVPNFAPGAEFYYRPPDWLQFQMLDVLPLLERSPFHITDTGSVGMTEELDATVIRIGSTAYQLGSGGLHSKDETITYRATDEKGLTDIDVEGYYPALIMRLGVYPDQIGPEFLTIYGRWRQQRSEAKAAGNKAVANSRKTLNNGTFGKLGSPYSIFYAPSELIQVTVTGQLALLMLIEMLELNGIQVVSANTDGIVTHCRYEDEWVRESVIAWWMEITTFKMEYTPYSMICSRDINNYIAIKTDGTVKLKGAYATPDPGPSGWPNPTGQICVDAVVEYLKNGTPLIYTIMACDDIRQFAYVRAVKGGGLLTQRPVLPLASKLTVKKQKMCLAQYGFNDYDSLVTWSRGDWKYLGKTVRWYYAKDSKASIRYLNSWSKIPRAEGVEEIMELPDTLPTDINYEWYEAEARSILADIGVNTDETMQALQPTAD